MSNRTALLFSVFLMLVGVSAAPAADMIEVPIYKEAKTDFADPASKAGRCLAADISDRSGNLLSAQLPEVEPGAYQMHVRLKISHTCNLITARLAFGLRATADNQQGGERELTIVDFEKPGEFLDFSFPVAVTSKKASLRLSVAWEWKDSTKVPRKMNASDLPTVDGAGLDDHRKGTADDVEIERPLSKLKYYLACDSAWLEKTGDAELSWVRVDKARYRPCETAIVEGTVINFAPQSRTFLLQAERIQSLGAPDKTVTASLTVPAASASQNFSLAVPLGDTLWGHEIRCSLKEGDRTVATASDFFTVHTNPWAVAIGGHTMDHTEYRASILERERQQPPTRQRKQYFNQIEFVFWAPDDFGNLTPTGKYWSGQMRRDNGAESTRLLIEDFHRRGIACSFYAKLCTPGGKSGYELLRKHPDWLYPDFYDVAQMDRWDRSTQMSSWPQLAVRRDIEAPFRHHAQEIIRSCKTFGWDTIRYDSAMNEPETVRNFKIVKDAVTQACPDFQWGYNSGHPSGYPPGMYDLMCAGGGLIMEEANVHAGKDSWPYEKCARRQLEFRDQVHPRGGHLVFCPYEATQWSDSVYQKILPICARAHGAWDSLKGQVLLADYHRFYTRYAGQLWDNVYVTPTNAPNRIRWSDGGTNLFLWSSFVYVRQPASTRTELIMHMVNRPPERINSYGDCRVPAPLQNLECTAQIPDGLKPIEVWRLSPELEPEQDRLAFKTEKDRIVFTVPKLRFWNVIVVQFEGTAKWQ
jgi:hypothetical protein